jgi:integrase
MKLADKRSSRDKNVVVPEDLPAPDAGNKVYYDDDTKGFGVRVTAAGARSFVLNYRTAGGTERRLTIGACSDWSVAAAREKAQREKRRVADGADPVKDKRDVRQAPTMADLCARFVAEHLPRKRPSTQTEYKALIDCNILPELGTRKVAEVAYEDIDRLHRKVTEIGTIKPKSGKRRGKGAKYKANRTLAVLSKMFNLAIRWKLRADNPVKGVERNHEDKRERYLSADEMKRLTNALAQHGNQQVANIFRMCILTGARHGEVRQAKWSQFEEDGTWVKPSAATKQVKIHRAPLSAPLKMLLAGIRAAAEKEAKRTGRPISEYVFPHNGGFRTELKDHWVRLRKAAKLVNVRPHDLRHTFASLLYNSGSTLGLIGGLLGHTNPQTTARYAHLFDDPLRAATERAATLVTGGPSAEVIPMARSR